MLAKVIRTGGGGLVGKGVSFEAVGGVGFVSGLAVTAPVSIFGLGPSAAAGRIRVTSTTELSLYRA